MTKNKINKETKTAELIKYRDLVLATIDYYLDKGLLKISTPDFSSEEHFKSLKIQAEEHFRKGRLTALKQWFRDLTEMQIETVDLEFNKFLQENTSYKIDIFESYHQRVAKIVEKGKITSDNQFYDINIMVNELSQTEPLDKPRIEILNKLLIEFENRKSK